MNPKRHNLNLAQLAREEVEKQLPLAQRKSQQLRIVGEANLPVWGNDGQLRQVIRNLLNNAIKYTPTAGQIICRCSIQADIADTEAIHGQPVATQWALLCITDNGMGISHKHLPRIFERFYRVESQGNISGTGLGLPIAQELARLHAGHITATSKPDEGSTFTLYLPLLEG